MAQLDTEAMQDQVEACQRAILETMIGWPVPVIMASLTTIAGGLIAQSAPSKRQARLAVAQVANGMQMVADACYPEGAASV